MYRRFVLVVFASFLLLGIAWDASADWARFRGPNGTGICDSAVPVEFGADKNMQWKLELPGKGVSSPIVVGDSVFVTCYSGYGISRDENSDINDLKRHLICVDRKNGKVKWDKTVGAVEEEDPFSGSGVPSHGYASQTPTSDGERVYAFFGKSGVVAFDLEGNKLWQTSVGTESGRARWGSAASPILYEDIVIVNASDESEALIGLDKKTGEEKWKSQAGGYADTWGTPALATGRGGTEVVLAVPGEIWAINANTGKISWYAPGNNGATHSVVIAKDLVYSIGGGRGSSSGVAVRLGGKGEITEVAWNNDAAGRFASPIVYNGHVYQISGGILSCFEANSGKKVFEKRLPENSVAANANQRDDGERRGGGRRRGGGQDFSSPIIADGKIYFTKGNGTVFVIAAKPEWELLAQNDLTFDRSGFLATPAADGGQLFVRSHTHLYCFGE